MYGRAIRCWFLLTLWCWGACTAQPVDPTADVTHQAFFRQLRTRAIQDVPAGMVLTVSVSDRRVYEWSIDVSTQTNFKVLAKAVGTDSSDVAATLDAWAAQERDRLAKLTIDAVSVSGIDPEFNPETDFTLSVMGRVLPGVQPTELPIDSDPTWYWIGFTGIKQPGVRSRGGKVVEPAGKPTGGEVFVEVVPDRAAWGWRRTITGKINITNKGASRVRLDSWSASDILVEKDGGGKPAEFFRLGFACEGGGGARYKFLRPGETCSEEFTVFTDRMHTMVHGYYLPVGAYQLSFNQSSISNVLVRCDQAKINVTLPEGEYGGPRIIQAFGATDSIVLLREDFTVQVSGAATGQALGAVHLDGYTGITNWLGATLVTSKSGRLVAYCPNRNSSIRITSLYGEAPSQSVINAPAGVGVGAGGLFPVSFDRNDTALLCATNYLSALIDITTGALVRSDVSKEQWLRVSPSGAYGVCVAQGAQQQIDLVAKGECAISVVDFKDLAKSRTEIVKGDGWCMEVFPGESGAYVSDNTASSVLYLPYRDGNKAGREFHTDEPAEFVGESPDGTLAALSWPRPQFARKTAPTTLGVFRVSDGERLCTIHWSEPRTAVMLADPPRIVSLARCYADGNDGFGNGTPWLSEAVEVHDAMTGELKVTFRVTPPEGLLSVPRK